MSATMVGRAMALLLGGLTFMSILVVAAPRQASLGAAEMCPPVTLSDLAPAEKPEPAPPRIPSPGGSGAGDTTTTVVSAPMCEPFVYPMTFPLAVAGAVISDFGDERDDGSRLHAGIDIRAPHLTAVVATRDGTVLQITGEAGHEDCCWMVLRHDDGWQSWYIHLNNDTYGTDDGLGLGVRADLDVGDEVSAGELLGWLGDSGNAEDTSAPHLHYELRTPAGVPVDASASVSAAAVSVEISLTESGAYLDDDGLAYEWVPEVLASRGMTWSCEAGGTSSCPEEVATPAQLRALARDLVGVRVPLLEGSYGPVTILGLARPHPFLIDKVLGCSEADACPQLGVTETELARLAAAIVRYRHGPETMLGLMVENARLRLPSVGNALKELRSGHHLSECQPPLDDSRLLPRNQALYLLLSWIGEIDAEQCPSPGEPTL